MIRISSELYSPARGQVLIVEDERLTRLKVVAMARELGLEVLEAGNAWEAIAMAGEFHPSTILLDGLLPGMHGFEVARFIRAMPAGYRPHITLMTAIYKKTSYQNDARLKYGIDSYLLKPFVLADLQRVLAHEIAAMKAVA